MHRASSVITVGFALTLLAMSAVIHAQNPGGSPEGKNLKNPVPATAESVAAGQALFARNCRFCHNADAKGNGPMAPKGTHPPDLTDATWLRGSTDGELFLVIRDGAGPAFSMKGYKGRLADADMWNVINFLRSIGPKK